MSDLTARAKQIITNEPDLCVEIARFINEHTAVGMSLTRRQRELLEYLEEYDAQFDAAPSYQEMADYIGLASKSGINRLVLALEKRGRIRRLPNRARAIEIVRAV